MSHRAALEYVLDLEMHGIKLGLEKICMLLEALGSPQEKYPCVLIGGTNGKGSVTAMVAEALARAGYRCGRYTSPHLVELKERICLNDQPIPEDELEKRARRVRRAIERLCASGRFEAPCTFFEATTAMALDYFAHSNVDIAILEVGMGGRFDATNTTEPILSVITNIDLDHQQYLGKTRTLIAREKVGIARRNRQLIAGLTDPASLATIQDGCVQAGARLAKVSSLVGAHGVPDAPAADVYVFPGSLPPEGGERVSFRTHRRSYGPIRLGLAGMHQVDNARTAIAVIEHLENEGFDLGRKSIEAGLSGVRWPGRLEHLSGHPLLILDSAHNPAGARALATYLSKRKFEDLTLVFGAMQDKSIERMARHLFPLARRVILTRVPYRRSADPRMLSISLASLNGWLTVMNDSKRALDVALALTTAGGAVCVCGSIYLVGAAIEHPEVQKRRRATRRQPSALDPAI